MSERDTCLKDGEEGVGEVVEVGARLLVVAVVEHVDVEVVELAAEELHAEQREDDHEESEQEEQAGDGLHRAEQRHDQVAQRRPVARELEYAQEAHAAQHAHAQRDLKVVGEADLGYAAEHDEAVEAVEHRDEVAAEAQTVHFEQHFDEEQHDKRHVRIHCIDITKKNKTNKHIS